MKSTKKALLSSVLALFLCFTMLVGSTFAWFTDSVTSADNKINAGTLDVDLYQWTATDASVEITNESDPLFSGDIIWEPGKTEVVYLSIKNNGTLALKYRVALTVTSVTTHELTDVMYYAIANDAKFGDVNAWDAANAVKAEKGVNATQAEDVALQPGDEHFFALSVHMDELATNEYMGESITFDIKVLAGQLASEEDSFGPNYDVDAIYPGITTTDPIGTATAVDVVVRGEDGYQLGSVTIPADAVEDKDEGHKVIIEPTYYEGNFTVAAGLETAQYDITVTNLKAGNTAELTVQLRIPAGLDPSKVAVYHKDTAVPGVSYNPNTGYVTFKTSSFSPYTVVYDAESEYEAPKVEDTMDRPTATVTYAPEYIGAGKIEWGNYGQWSPTEGLEANLEAAFVFACPENLDPKVEAAFEYWYCDFYVSLDKALGANQLFLGGNYGSFGWVGFHNGDLTLDANTEIGLLESVTTNPWTYADVRDYVGTFTCGVGDVNNALDGATFTVMLRLTNPENADQFYNVNVVTYTFGGNAVIDGVTVVTTAEGLQDAVENGSENIMLGGDIDLNDLVGGN